MTGNALLLSLTLFMAFCFLLMDGLIFLASNRQAIFHDYCWAIALYGVLLFGNLFAAFFLLARRFFHKHTGQKLVYVDKQLRIGGDVIDWQHGLKRYSGVECESQYQSWKQTGKLSETQPQSSVHKPGQQFQTFLAIPNVGRRGPSEVGEAAQSIAQLPAGQRRA